jgi:hypothetical protein
MVSPDFYERLAGWYRWACLLTPVDIRPGCVARVSDSASSQGAKRIRRDRAVQGGIKSGMVFTLPVPECDVADAQSHTCLHRDVKVFTWGGLTLGVAGALDWRRCTRVPGPMHRLTTIGSGVVWSGVFVHRAARSNCHSIALSE